LAAGFADFFAGAALAAFVFVLVFDFFALALAIVALPR
jgi:hypothetical protein